jgi:osmotically-inducible protein OsmY
VLTSQPGLSISSLVVRRLGNGVCLSGVVESTDDPADVCRLAQQVSGVNEVMNRLLIRSITSN